MTAIYISFTLAIALLTVLKWPKIKAILFVGIIAAAPIIYFDTLSRPKLLTDEWRNDEEVRIVGYSWKEGIAVYYWLELPGVTEPRYYWEPWSDEAKKRVEQMQKGAEANQEMKFSFPFERSLETDKPKTIHPMPPPALPEKQPAAPIQEFDA